LNVGFDNSKLVGLEDVFLEDDRDGLLDGIFAIGTGFLEDDRDGLLDGIFAIGTEVGEELVKTESM
jgi:hypothetical protein